MYDSATIYAETACSYVCTFAYSRRDAMTVRMTEDVLCTKRCTQYVMLKRALSDGVVGAYMFDSANRTPSATGGTSLDNGLGN